MSTDPRVALSQLWDEEIGLWLSGVREVSEELRPWFNAYQGNGPGEVNLEAFPEPFLGDLFARPMAVFLALNPGPVAVDFQYADGIFVKELRKASYSGWAAKWRYLDRERPRVDGGLKFHGKRLNFLRRWYSDEGLDRRAMLAFELYPWHSEKLNAPFRWSEGARSLVKRYVWDPIGASGAQWIFGVGAGFQKVFESLGLEILGVLGEGGEPVPFNKKRRVAVARPNMGVIALAMNNFNQAAPPNAEDTITLRRALEERGWLP